MYEPRSLTFFLIKPYYKHFNEYISLSRFFVVAMAGVHICGVVFVYTWLKYKDHAGSRYQTSVLTRSPLVYGVVPRI